jgi:hypothetical protein
MSQQFLDQSLLLLVLRQLASQLELLSYLQLALRHLLFVSFRPLLSELRLRLPVSQLVLQSHL